MTPPETTPAPTLPCRHGMPPGHKCSVCEAPAPETTPEENYMARELMEAGIVVLPGRWTKSPGKPAETPTPRTDGAADVGQIFHGTHEVVLADFTRSIERELAAARHELGCLRGESVTLSADLEVANARIAELEQSLDKIANEHRERGLGAPLGGRIAELEQQPQAALDGHKLAFDAVTEAGARELALREALCDLERYFILNKEDRHHCPWCYVRGQDVSGNDLGWADITHSPAIDGTPCPIGAALANPPPPVVRREVAEALAEALRGELRVHQQWANGRTHWTGCENEHYDCAAIGRIEAALAKYQEATQKT